MLELADLPIFQGWADARRTEQAAPSHELPNTFHTRVVLAIPLTAANRYLRTAHAIAILFGDGLLNERSLTSSESPTWLSSCTRR